MKKDIDDILLELFPDEYDINADDDVKEDFWRNLSEKDKYTVNGLHLRATANPEYDYLICWEPGRFDDDEDVTDFDNLYDVDYLWWEFQRDAQWESIEELKEWMEKDPVKHTPERVAESINRFNETYEKGYTMYLSGDWYRLIENDVFLYSQFIGARWFINYQMEEFLDDLQENNIPYSFREKDGDPLSFLNEWDPQKRYDANGRERELEAFLDKMRKYQGKELFERIDAAIEKYSQELTGKVFRRDRGYEEGENFDPFTDFIFFDELSLKNVNPKMFLNTFRENQADYSLLQKIIDELKVGVESDFEKIYRANRDRYL